MWCYDQARIKRYTAHKLGNISGDAVGIGVCHKDVLVCACLYFNHSYKNSDIEMSLVSDEPRIFTTEALKGFLGYPFNQIRCNRITAKVEAKNTVCRRLLKKIGFVEEGVLREASQGNDLVIYGLLRSDYRYRTEPIAYDWLDPENITPIHSVKDHEKVNQISNNMKRDGWLGNPIPIIATDRNYAMTGTHRIAAAKEAGIRVKVYFVNTEKFTETLYLQYLRDSGEFTAAQLIEDELKKGNQIYVRT